MIINEDKAAADKAALAAHQLRTDTQGASEGSNDPCHEQADEHEASSITHHEPLPSYEDSENSCGRAALSPSTSAATRAPDAEDDIISPNASTSNGGFNPAADRDLPPLPAQQQHQASESGRGWNWSVPGFNISVTPTGEVPSSFGPRGPGDFAGFGRGSFGGRGAFGRGRGGFGGGRGGWRGGFGGPHPLTHLPIVGGFFGPQPLSHLPIVGGMFAPQQPFQPIQPSQPYEKSQTSQPNQPNQPSQSNGGPPIIGPLFRAFSQRGGPSAPGQADMVPYPFPYAYGNPHQMPPPLPMDMPPHPPPSMPPYPFPNGDPQQMKYAMRALRQQLKAMPKEQRRAARQQYKDMKDAQKLAAREQKRAMRRSGRQSSVSSESSDSDDDDDDSGDDHWGVGRGGGGGRRSGRGGRGGIGGFPAEKRGAMLRRAGTSA